MDTFIHPENIKDEEIDIVLMTCYNCHKYQILWREDPSNTFPYYCKSCEYAQKHGISWTDDEVFWSDSENEDSVTEEAVMDNQQANLAIQCEDERKLLILSTYPKMYCQL